MGVQVEKEVQFVLYRLDLNKHTNCIRLRIQVRLSSKCRDIFEHLHTRYDKKKNSIYNVHLEWDQLIKVTLHHILFSLYHTSPLLSDTDSFQYFRQGRLNLHLFDI